MSFEVFERLLTSQQKFIRFFFYLPLYGVEKREESKLFILQYGWHMLTVKIKISVWMCLTNLYAFYVLL